MNVDSSSMTTRDPNLPAEYSAGLDRLSANFGMLLELIDKSPHSSMKFCSSDHPNPSRRPRLVIEYIPIEPTDNDGTI